MRCNKGLPRSRICLISCRRNQKIIRRISKIDSCSIAGYSQPNVQKINQDNFFIEKNFFEDDEQFYECKSDDENEEND